MKNIICFTMFFITVNLFSQSSEFWKNKVADKVFLEYAINDNVEFLIQFEAKPDLSLAKTISNKYDRTKYVFEVLKSFSAKSQGRLINFLDSKNINYKSFYIVNAILVESNFTIMSELAKFEEVQYIEANPSFKDNRKLPNEIIDLRDPNSLEWGIEKINADDVWAMGYTGNGVVIGGQDTGYRWTHEALKSKYRGWDGAIANHNYNWHDAIDSIDSHNTGSNPCGLSIKVPCDDQGHGTHTMGTMVGKSGTNQIGVAPDAKWIGCRNMERGWGKPSTYIDCFEWFLAPTDTNNLNPDPALAPDVINNSWHCPASEGCDNSNYSTMEDAVNNLRNAGVVVVVSAGNSGSNCSTISSPPNFFESSFDVGATTSSDTIASFSSRGPTNGYGSSILKPNISAPGVNIRSSTKASDSDYGNNSGTSMAGPHVAGAVALLLDAYPIFKGNPDTIEYLLENSAVFLETSQSCGGISGTSIPNNTYGYGRLDILAAINLVTFLPLKIINFEGNLTTKHEVQLDWEIDNHQVFKIELQRSSDGIDWETVFETFDENSFLDITPLNGMNYYRLKIISDNGNSTLSKVISIYKKAKITLVAYPSIIKNNESINVSIFSESKSEIDIVIYNSLGEPIVNFIESLQSEKENISIPITNVGFGVYFIVFKDNNSGLVIGKKKFIVVN